MVTVSISETYDLHTVVNKMTLIGIHTPNKSLIQRMYPGLCENYRQFRIKGVSVVLSTAQTLPLGVGEIGLDADKIRPQDMMNPILYKACSNDSWNTLEYRLRGLIDQLTSNNNVPLHGDMAVAENDCVTSIEDEHGVYYALLSNREGFRYAMPRQGLRMNNLVPLVHYKLFTDAVNSTPGRGRGDSQDAILEMPPADSGVLSKESVYDYPIRGRAVRMPWMNTTYLTGINPPSTGNVQSTSFQRNGMGDGLPANYQIKMPDIPPVMLGAIVLPPVTATTGILYYRMVCRAVIEFRGVRPMTDITSFADLDNSVAPAVYHTDYPAQSKEMDATTDMVDVKNATIEKIMEGR